MKLFLMFFILTLALMPLVVLVNSKKDKVVVVLPSLLAGTWTRKTDDGEILGSFPLIIQLTTRKHHPNTRGRLCHTQNAWGNRRIRITCVPVRKDW